LDGPEGDHTRRLCVARQIVSVARLRGTVKDFNDWADGMSALRGALEQHGHWPITNHATDDAARLARRWAFLATIDIQKLSFDDALDCTGFRFPHTFQAQSATFRGDADFRSARFRGDAVFQTANFESVTAFTAAVFDGPATFQAIQSKRAFSLARATFFEVPDFIQAEFSEAPRLDNLHIRRIIRLPGRGVFCNRSTASISGSSMVSVAYGSV